MTQVSILSIRFSYFTRAVICFCAAVVPLLSFVEVMHAQPNLGGAGPYAASGDAATDKLKNKESNKFDVQTGSGSDGEFKTNSVEDIRDNMQKLFGPVLNPPISMDPNAIRNGNTPQWEGDKWFSPHLRDIRNEEYPPPPALQRPNAAGLRAYAGTDDWGLFGCDGACPLCRWPHPWHWTTTCCGVSTKAYAAMITDTNFKTCCVREGEQGLTEEEIACRHPNGDGWSGLWEYYFPVQALGWESQRGTTLIATKQKAKKCLDDSDDKMANPDWAKKAIEAGLAGMKADASGVKAPSKGEIENLRPSDKNQRFSDSLSGGGGLTMSVNYGAMDPTKRRELALRFCMHEDQFMKLMDPRYDKIQKGGGESLAALDRTIPLWANYCPKAVELMTDPNRTAQVINIDGTPTNFVQGMAVYKADPLYCQKMNVAADPITGKFLSEGPLSGNSAGIPAEGAAGYTCLIAKNRTGGFQTRMVPVSLYSTAQIDQRTLDHAIPFAIAGAYYAGEMAGPGGRYYKPFEPQPYSQQFKLFKGKRFSGEVGGGVPAPGLNEDGILCSLLQGYDYQGKNRADQIYLSEKTHPPFDSPKFSASENQKFNQMDRQWAGDKSSDQDNFHNREFDSKVLNYGATFRIFATCPKGYVRWRGATGDHFWHRGINNACGEEHFGGVE